ncbi:MAG TPA: peptidase U35 [Burkholderiaceae bacterium]|nr:peptidase U35 [Burkholderiaceae bacterium]
MPNVRSLPLQTRLVPISTVDESARTFEVVWTTGAQVRRFDWVTWSYYLEELSLDPAAIRMARMDSGAPLLNTHQQWDLSSVLGVVQRAWLETGEGRAQCLFSDRDDEMNAYWRDVTRGIIRNVSCGYIVHRYVKTDPPELGGLPVWTAIDWEPAEISLVPVGADVLAGVRSLGAAGPEQLDERQRQQLIEAATRAVGHRSFACEIVGRAPASARTVSLPAAPAAQPQESTMDETEVESRGTPTPAANPPAPAPVQATPAAATRSEAEIRADEQARIGGIRNAVALARRATHGITTLDQAFEDGLVARNLTLDQARAEIFARLEAHSAQNGPQRSAAGIETLRDEQQQRRGDMAEAIYHRVNPSATLPDSARRFRGLTLFELARRALDLHGISTEGLSRHQVVAMAMGNDDSMGFRAAHGVSDFTVALASTVNRTLRAAYESAPRTFTQWATPGTLSDFRAATRVAIAGNLTMEKVNEFGEFKRGKLVDAGETIQLATYGKIIGVTRQVVINDDINFLQRLPRMAARAAADFESDTVYGVLKGNPNMADGNPLFHSAHGNLSAAGAAIGEAGLTEARKALRLQTDPSGNGQPLNLTGRYLITGATKETEAQKFLNAVIVATKAADTNVFQSAYTLVVEPRLDKTNPLEWFLVADPSQIDTVEYAYLEGEQGLYTEQRMGFDVDGLELKARLDFAAKATDWRGMFKNTGA